MAEGVIIVHTSEHVAAALEAAGTLGLPVTLQSAPDAIFYAGSLYLLRLYEQAKAAFPQAQSTFILDCADAGAEAVAALQMGHRRIRSSAPPPLRDRLADIARQCGAEITAGEAEALDLGNVRDARAACRKWLAATQRIETVGKTG